MILTQISLQETSKAINQKNEETMSGAAVKRGAPLQIVKPTQAMQRENLAKKGGKTGIAAQIRKLK